MPPPISSHTRNPITPALFHTVRSLLAAHWRHCEIARETGLSLWTIARIDSDRRRLGSHHAPRDEPLAEEIVEDDVDLPEDDAPPDYVATRLRRCPGCGGMVYQWPCLTCRLRAPLAGTGKTARRRDKERGRQGDEE
jgi:hypothetical protein